MTYVNSEMSVGLNELVMMALAYFVLALADNYRHVRYNP